MKKQPPKKQPPLTKPGKQVSEPLVNKPWLHIILILIITFITYYPALDNDWTNWDDYGYVKENPFVQHFKPADMPKAFLQQQQAVSIMSP